MDDVTEKMHAAFDVYLLNEQGRQNAHEISKAFNALLIRVQELTFADIASDAGRRLESLVTTKLEEACFFAKKAMASQSRYRISEK